ncbi:ribonuclease M5 [Vaginisenegalia massiliensis]|uniref:ribonuclease M5 n=1 Tax=Vaginisenegalia massiliensis TaxID=2058294 RepID=UPI000F532CB8|nr:ribonuclease M5 [Vaginisenegalia massiliensis]
MTYDIKDVPREIIIVEGRDDTKRLIETFGPQVKTIETGGSALSRKVQAEIKALAADYEFIILTDPDYQGQRLRNLLSQLVPQAKHAFIEPELARSTQRKASLGVEHATPETIRQALAEVMTPSSQEQMEWIPLHQLVQLGLIGHPQANLRRQLIAKELHLGYVNGKQLQKRLAQYQIRLEQIQAILEKEE